jgi:hypothetical protein
MLKGKEKELIEGAGSLAAHRLKTNFILHRIAERRRFRLAAKRSMNVSANRPRNTTCRSTKCAKNSRNMTGWMASRKRFCWARPLIS